MTDTKEIDRSDPQTLAEACAAAMWRTDRASQALGMAIERIAPGEAVISMPIRTDMTNGFDICHGGYMFTLADSTFAFACNTYGERTVAQHCNVTFLRPVKSGAKLIAHAIERVRAGRGGIYDVTVRDQDHIVVAEFRGHSRSIGGDILAPDQP